MKLINIFLILFIVEIIAEVGLEFSPVITAGLSLKNLLLYILTIFAIMKARQSSNKMFNFSHAIHRFNWIFLIWVLIITVTSILISLAGKGYSAVEALSFYKSGILDPYLFFVVFMNFSTDKKQVNFLINGMFLVIVITGVMTLVEVALPGVSFFGLDDDSRRPKGGLGEPNQTAAVLCLFVLPMISCAIGRVRGRNFYILGVIVVLATIAVTGSRGGILGFFVGISFLIYLLRNDIRIEKKLMIFISSILGGIIVWLILPEYYQQLLLSRFSVFQSDKIDWDHASAGRTIMLDAGIDAWLSSPLIGSGWRAYNTMTGHTSHNTYLEVLVNAGPIAVILYLLIFTNIFKIYRRTVATSIDDKFLIKGFSAGLLALLVAVSFVNLYTPWFVVWAFIGLSVGYCYYVKYEEPQNDNKETIGFTSNKSVKLQNSDSNNSVTLR